MTDSSTACSAKLFSGTLGAPFLPREWNFWNIRRTSHSVLLHHSASNHQQTTVNNQQPHIHNVFPRQRNIATLILRNPSASIHLLPLHAQITAALLLTSSPHPHTNPQKYPPPLAPPLHLFLRLPCRSHRLLCVDHPNIITTAPFTSIPLSAKELSNTVLVA